MPMKSRLKFGSPHTFLELHSKTATEEEGDLYYNWERKQNKNGSTQVSRSPETPNRFEKTLFKSFLVKKPNIVRFGLSVFYPSVALILHRSQSYFWQQRQQFTIKAKVFKLLNDFYFKFLLAPEAENEKVLVNVNRSVKFSRKS